MDKGKDMVAKMKKASAIAIPALAALVLAGCEFLVRGPNAKESEEEFFKTEDQALRATTAVYDVLGWWGTTEVTEWFLGDIVSDDALKGGESPVDQGDVQLLRDFSYSAQNGVLSDRWKAHYQGINRANRILGFQGKPGGMDPAKWRRVRAEARFLRAWFYFSLANSFGGVPLVLTIPRPGEYCSGRASRAQTFAQIEKDLKEAADSLPAKYDAADLGRATQGAALAYLAKAYVYQGKWAEAEAVAKSVVDSAWYRLEPDYAKLFTAAGENGPESIFEIQYHNAPTPEWGDGNEGQMTSIFQGNRTAKLQEGWGFNDPTEEFVKAFDDSLDPRLYNTVIREGDTLWAGTPAAQPSDMSQSWTGYHNRKYLVEYSATMSEMSNDPANWRAYRYADLVLFYAEALIQNGKVAEGVAQLNLIRARAKASSYPKGLVRAPAAGSATLAPVTAASKEDALKALYEERRREFGMEGQRFFDVVRQGRGPAEFTTTTATGKMGGGARTFVAGQHEHFPIPGIEVQLCKELAKDPG